MGLTYGVAFGVLIGVLIGQLPICMVFGAAFGVLWDANKANMHSGPRGEKRSDS
jgi:hypothetical protein